MVCNQPRDPGYCNCGELFGGGRGGGDGSAMGGGGGSGGGTVGGGNGGGGAIAQATLQEFCTNYPTAACAARIACGKYSDAGMDVCLQNEANVVELCRRANAGFVDFNGVVAARCLAELQLGQVISCAGDFPPCGSLLGSLAIGSPFDVFFERPNGCGTMTCAPGTRCDNHCATPRYLPPLDAGDLCDGFDGITRDCPPTTVCATEEDGGYRCQGFTPRGGDCSNKSCNEFDFCDLSQPTPICRERLAAEAPCGSNAECFDGVCRTDGHCGALDAGARCVKAIECGAPYNSPSICLGLVLSADGGTIDAGVCGPRPREGQACSRDWARLYDSCRMEVGESCLDGFCTLLRPLTRPLGSECPLRPWGYTAVPFYGFASCQRGLACRPSPTAHPPQTGRCQPAQPVGGACRDEFECEQGLSCFTGEDGGSQCVRLAGPGESCMFTGCMRDLSCTSRIDGGADCTPLLAVDAGCMTQTCVPSARCVADVCEPLSAAGAACDYGSTCQSGVCQFHQCVDQCMR